MGQNNDETKVGRRRTLQLLGAGLATAGGLFVLGACNKDQGSGGQGGSTSQGSTSAGGCNTPIEEASKQLRKTLQYKEKADNPEKVCKACAQYDTGKFGDCGGCKLFQGPVKPEGGCLSFAPKSAAPAASSG